MDINVKVKVEAPGVMEAVLALAETMLNMKLVVEMKKDEGQVSLLQGEVNDKAKSEEIGVVTNEEEIISLEDVRGKLAVLAQAGKQREVKALINKFGGNKLTEVAPENFRQLLKEAEEIK